MKIFGKLLKKWSMKGSSLSAFPKLSGFAFLFLISIHLPAQDSLLNYLLVGETNQNTLLLRWEIEGGNTCNGMEIYRSVDDQNYYLIHSIDGICGNVNSSVAYQYEDENPVSNQTNYYKIRLGLGDLSRAVSTFYIHLNTNGYFVFPNPADDELKIYFQNEDYAEAEIQVMNLSGQILLTSKTNAEFWEPDLSELAAGLYIFSIEFQGKRIQGHFIKN